LKVKVLNIRVIVAPNDFIVRLEGGGKILDLCNAPVEAAIGIMTIEADRKHCNQSANVAPQLNLNMLLQEIIPADRLKQVELSKLIKENCYVAEAVMGDEKVAVLPSVGVYLAMLFNKPIYFESEIAVDDKRNAMVV